MDLGRNNTNFKQIQIMKKILISLALVLSVLASCNPAEDSYDNNAKTYTEQALSDCFSFTQADENGNAAEDGNYFTFTTSPSTILTILTKGSDGSENVLVRGESAGKFAIVPTRGSDPNQKFYIRSMNADGTWTETEKSANVFVPGDLSAEMKLLCGDDGRKVWKWNTNAPGGQVWGNLGNWGGFDGKDFALNGSNKWWGVTTDAEFEGQVDHTGADGLMGDANLAATMVATEDGYITCYDKDGNEIRRGKFTINNFDPTYSNTKEYCGILHTDPGTILFPYEINSGKGNKPTDFEIAYVSPTRLVLMYPDDGEWGKVADKNHEGTFWQFVSETDLKGVLTDNNEATWTWDTEHGPWGNCSYGGMAYGGAASLTGNTWWVVDNGLDAQIADYGYKFADNEQATMTFKLDGTFSKSSGGKGTFSFDPNTTSDIGGWNEGKTWGRLTIKGDGILFPVRVNKGEVTNEFDVAYFDDEHLVLTYPNFPKGSEGADGNWNEGTFWRFKKVTNAASAKRRR